MEEKNAEHVVVHPHIIDAETRYANEYTSCCSKRRTDKRLLQYASRFTISILMLGFASIQIIRSHDCDALVPFYTSLITFIIGAWVKMDTSKIQQDLV